MFKILNDRIGFAAGEGTNATLFITSSVLQVVDTVNINIFLKKI